MSNDEIEQIETECDWLMGLGIGCSIEWCKARDLFNFAGYTEWADMKSLYYLCKAILENTGSYTDDIDYTAYQYPNTYFK